MIPRGARRPGLGALECAWAGAFCEPAKRKGAMPWRDSMVTNGERKANNFGKLVRQKVGLFSKVGSARAVRAPAGGAPVVVVRLPPSKMRAETREQGRARRLGSDAFGDKGAQTSNVDGSVVNARSTVPGREANKIEC